MQKQIMTVFLLAISIAFSSCGNKVTKKLSTEDLRDKIAGGWAGKMIGVTYGGPTEFRATGKTYDKELMWTPDQVKGALSQDDLYVQMSFMMAMDKYGMDAPAEKFAESFANAGYRLWCANVTARKNFFDGIMPPNSGHPKYNLWADAIDFQIEADYIGFMSPGMPQTSNQICDKIGHIMNYGDGVYGGMFVSALYTQAFFDKDMNSIIKNALKAIPAESDYAKCIQDVIDLHTKYPDDWRKAWNAFQEKWGNTDISVPFQPFNIDAKINGSYIVMGLLYGDGDFAKTMEITIRCGQDSDCNPSNAAAVLGVRDGYTTIPDEWKSGIPEIADSLFIYTDYSFNKVVDNTLKYAKELIQANGGKIEDGMVYIKRQLPKAPEKVEVSFPGIKPLYPVDLKDPKWTWKGNWKEVTRGWQNQTLKVTEQKNAEASLTFEGTGILLTGAWDRDGGKADIYLDDQLVRTIDTYYWVANAGFTGAYLYHVLDLSNSEHTIRMVLNGEKNQKATGAKIYIGGAVVYGTAQK
ncbi:MAG: ADP-ribosylglycohydrolase family protein [bacterium]